MIEWLVDVRKKLEPSEYVIVLITFFSIQMIGPNPGIAVGILASALNFLFIYANQVGQGRDLTNNRPTNRPTDRPIDRSTKPIQPTNQPTSAPTKH